MPPERKSLLLSVAAAALVAVFLLQCFLASSVKSVAWDEPGDLAAGLSYWLTGKFTVNPQHPPLLKELMGLGMLAAGARWPKTESARQLLDGNAGFQWTVGSDIAIAAGVDRLMFWARLPMILVAAMLAIVLFVWGRKMLGGTAALGALFLFALDPTVVAHSYLTTMDAGFAAFTVLFFFALWRYLQSPGRTRLLLCGAALGAVLSTKFSAVVLLPVAGLLLLAAAWRDRAGMGKPAHVGPNDACPCGSGRKFKKCHGDPAHLQASGSPLVRQAVTAAGVFLAILAVAVVVIEALYFFPSDPTLYLKGLRMVNADHDPDFLYFLAGSLDRRFPGYFAAAYLLKEPLPAIVLALWGLFLLWKSKTIALLDKLFLLLPPAVLFAAHSLAADNIGIRYIIPALPFAYLIGGIALAELIRGALWKRALAGALCAWVAVAAIGIYPDHLSYFNESACLLRNPSQIGLDGGSKCGTLWLDDSNVDWGEGLKQLKDWVDRHADGRLIRLGYFGSFPPEAYGLRHTTVEMADWLQGPQPGLYALSAHSVARGRAAGATWLDRVAPVAVVGHCMYIYDIK